MYPLHLRTTQPPPLSSDLNRNQIIHHEQSCLKSVSLWFSINAVEQSLALPHLITKTCAELNFLFVLGPEPKPQTHFTSASRLKYSFLILSDLFFAFLWSRYLEISLVSFSLILNIYHPWPEHPDSLSFYSHLLFFYQIKWRFMSCNKKRSDWCFVRNPETLDWPEITPTWGGYENTEEIPTKFQQYTRRFTVLVTGGWHWFCSLETRTF